MSLIGRSRYVAFIAECEGTSLTFNESTQVPDEHPEGGVVGGVVTVIAGRGAGQVLTYLLKSRT